jgi:hypothetical protein
MFPKKGNFFPRSPHAAKPSAYRSAIAESLKAELGDTHQAIKIVRRWTGTSERTVKNWFGAKNGPGGEQLITLMRHSDRVLDVVLQLADRPAGIGGARLLAAREALLGLLKTIDSIVGEQ